MLEIIELLKSVIHFFTNTIQSIVWFCTNIPELIGLLYEAIGYAPPFLLPFLTLSLAATALFAIIRLL